MVIHLKAGHAQFNRKSEIFGLQIGSFPGRSFPDRWSREKKTLGTRVGIIEIYINVVVKIYLRLKIFQTNLIFILLLFCIHYHNLKQREIPTKVV